MAVIIGGRRIMPRIRKAAQAARASAAAVWKIALYIRLSKEDWKDDGRAAGRTAAQKEPALDASRAYWNRKKYWQVSYRKLKQIRLMCWKLR
jgi:hypothetical protein